jgi:hypothetical protein
LIGKAIGNFGCPKLVTKQRGTSDAI